MNGLFRYLIALFIGPVLLVYGLFFMLPALAAFDLSLTHPVWAGLDNYPSILGFAKY